MENGAKIFEPTYVAKYSSGSLSLVSFLRSPSSLKKPLRFVLEADTSPKVCLLESWGIKAAEEARQRAARVKRGTKDFMLGRIKNKTIIW